MSPSRSLLHASIVCLAFVWACWSRSTVALCWLCSSSIAAWVWSERTRWTASGRFGPANVVTAIRLLIAIFIALLPHGAAIPWAGILLCLFFALDGLDGRLARQSGTSSAFGAAFDTEVDAFMTAIACLVAVDNGLASPWVLVVGGLRYAFVVLTFNTTNDPEPPRRWGRWAYSALMVGLTAALILPHPLTCWVLAIGAAWVGISFGRSFLWAFAGR